MNWDDWDVSNGMRDKFAQLVSSVISGMPDAIPEQEDYNIADKIRALIENEVNKW